MNVISMCWWKRSAITKKVIEHLNRCVGISKYHLVIHIDGNGDTSLPSLSRCVTCCPTTVIMSEHNLGLSQSTKRVLTKAFSMSDYVIHVEDDIALAIDALRYFEWARQFGKDRSIIAVGAWEHSWKTPEDVKSKTYLSTHGGVVGRHEFFNCWGWATWKDRFDDMLNNWSNMKDRWAFAVEDLRVKKKQYQLAPLVSRAQNIGEGGVHRGAEILPYWADSSGFIHPSQFTLSDSP